MEFSGVDKALLLRTARELEQQAKALEKSETVGGSWAGKRKVKMQFDAYHRDARDLRALVKRLSEVEALQPKRAVPAAVEGAPGG